MKLLFIFSDLDAQMIFLQTTSGIKRRCVEIELTKEQEDALNIKKVGVNCGKDVFETLESISTVLS
jgi:hypothetical protein